MKQLIIITALVLLSCASSFAQKNVYIIDGKKVEKYDGSQLVHKKIISYSISQDGNGTNTHTIITDAGRNTSEYEGHVIKKDDSRILILQKKAGDNPLIILNEQISSADTLNGINPKDITKITIYKAGSEAAEKYGEKGKDGVMLIQTKKSSAGEPLVFVDGKEIEGNIKDIKAETINDIEVYKPGSEVAKSYGEKGKNGVIKVRLKK